MSENLIVPAVKISSLGGIQIRIAAEIECSLNLPSVSVIVLELNAVPEPAPENTACYLVRFNRNAARGQTENDLISVYESRITIHAKRVGAVPRKVFRSRQQSVVAGSGIQGLGQGIESRECRLRPGIAQRLLHGVAGRSDSAVCVVGSAGTQITT